MCKLIVLFSVLFTCFLYVTVGVPMRRKYRNFTVQAYYIQTIQNGILHDVDIERTIHSSSNLIDGLPKGVSFVIVSITDQHLPLLFTNSFSGLKADRLVINRCNIIDIEANTFNDVTLGRLDLSENQLYNIKHYYFLNLSVDALYLSYNRIKYIEKGAFEHIARRDQEDFKNPMIEGSKPLYNDPSNLRDIKDSTEIRLDGNKLRTVEVGVFNNLTVSMLSLRSNKINMLKSGSFKHTNLLTSLILDDNRIKNITKNIFQSTGLKHLSLRNNKIRHIEAGSFNEIPEIETIDLSKNKLKEIRKGIFSNLFVEKLDLSENEISSIEPGAFERLPDLKILNLENNKLNDVDERDFYKEIFVHISYPDNFVTNGDSGSICSYNINDTNCNIL